MLLCTEGGTYTQPTETPYSVVISILSYGIRLLLWHLLDHRNPSSMEMLHRAQVDLVTRNKKCFFLSPSIIFFSPWCLVWRCACGERRGTLTALRCAKGL